MRARLNCIQFNTRNDRLLAGIAFFLGFVALFSTSAKAEVQTEMRAFNDSFISPYFEATQKTNYQFVGAQLKSHSSSEDGL